MVAPLALVAAHHQDARRVAERLGEALDQPAPSSRSTGSASAEGQQLGRALSHILADQVRVVGSRPRLQDARTPRCRDSTSLRARSERAIAGLQGRLLVRLAVLHLLVERDQLALDLEVVQRLPDELPSFCSRFSSSVEGAALQQQVADLLEDWRAPLPVARACCAQVRQNVRIASTRWSRSTATSSTRARRAGRLRLAEAQVLEGDDQQLIRRGAALDLHRVEEAQRDGLRSWCFFSASCTE